MIIIDAGPGIDKNPIPKSRFFLSNYRFGSTKLLKYKEREGERVLG